MRVITIDGPAGAGKSTVARRLADRLGWRLLDTGAMYRAVTVAALRDGVDLKSDQDLGELTGRIVVDVRAGEVWLDGVEVTSRIRDAEVTRSTRHAADSPSVRRHLVAWQRAFAEAEGDVVTEGRDQGTIVFPDAYRKFYLTASDLERARRRHVELAPKDPTITVDEVLRDIQRRDAEDASRSIAPMRPAVDAQIVDSTGLDLDRVVELLELTIQLR